MKSAVVCALERYMWITKPIFASGAMESGLENPFRCEVCAEEYDDLAYEG